MLTSRLCDHIDAYILVDETVTVTGAGADDAKKQLDERSREILFKNCARFTDCMSQITSTQVDYAKDDDFVMSIYNLIKYSDNYSKTSGSLWQYYDDEPNDLLTNSESFKYKTKITGKTPSDDNPEDV